MEIKVSVENVDLTSVVGEHYVQTGEDDYGRVPQTLGQAVAVQIADDLKRDDSYKTLKQQVLSLREAEVREQLKPIVTEAIQGEIRRTNQYGEQYGEPVTLRSLIIDEVQKVLTKKDGYDRNAATFIEKIVRDEVERALKKEIADALAEEKAKVVAAVRAKAAELIADAVKQGIGR